MIAMSERAHKVLLGAEALILLLPLTLFTALMVAVSYPAYPMPMKPLQIVFDLGMVLKIAAVVAAWRLVTAHLSRGRTGVATVHPAWSVLLGLGALLGLVAGVIALWHALNPENAPVIIGYILLSPAAALLPVLLHLRHERYAAIGS